MKWQRGVAEELLEEVGAVSQPLPFGPDFVVDLLHGVRREVGEAPILEIAPDLLHGVEFWSIGREPLRLPAGMGREILADVAMLVRPAQIPEEDQRAAVLAAEVVEEIEDLGAPDVRLGVQGQIERHAPSARGHDEGGHARDLLARPRAHAQRRRDAPAAPGPANQRRHQEACFVEADQPGAQATQFFLTRDQSSCSQ